MFDLEELQKATYRQLNVIARFLQCPIIGEDEEEAAFRERVTNHAMSLERAIEDRVMAERQRGNDHFDARAAFKKSCDELEIKCAEAKAEIEVLKRERPEKSGEEVFDGPTSKR